MTIKNKKLYLPILLLAGICLLSGIFTELPARSEERATPILQAWQGDYPVEHLNRLPLGQRLSRTGYLGNLIEFARVWRTFNPLDTVPYVDFSEHLVVFSRNLTFYNRMAIARVIIKQGVADILARETLSAMPIEDKVAMAMALIPRTGVKAIAVGNERILVTPYDPAVASDPLNTSYIIEGEEIFLKNGHAETAAAPHSATKTRTLVIGDMVPGDLDHDADLDTALFLVHDPGGSGTFYYVAAAENIHGQHLGTNAVLLGDRIAPKDLEIQNGMIVVRYAKREVHESMGSAPSIETGMHLVFGEGKLKALKH